MTNANKASKSFSFWISTVSAALTYYCWEKYNKTQKSNKINAINCNSTELIKYDSEINKVLIDGFILYPNIFIFLNHYI